MLSSVDVLIVGGGPAGLAAAIALRKKGLSCLVVDSQPPKIDKACGEGLMPDALEALETLGVRLTEKDGHVFKGIRFASDRHQVHASFPEGFGIGVRRTQLHERLIEHAEYVGAELSWNSRVELVDRNKTLVNGEPVSHKWLIGADGQASKVRRWSGLDSSPKKSVRYGFRRHYEVKPWSDSVEVHWSRRGQLYITPISADCICVVLVSADSTHGRRDLLADFPAVAYRLANASHVTEQRGAATVTRKLERVADRSIALIGDASGSTDAVTGEGLAMSFRQALALSQAISAQNLEYYNTAHRSIGKLPHRMGFLMLLMDRWPALGSRAIQALSSSPDLFEDLIAIHLGKRGLCSFALRDGLYLIHKMLLSHPAEAESMSSL
jgi:flavin-dependent dehydrogenase